MILSGDVKSERNIIDAIFSVSQLVVQMAWSPLGSNELKRSPKSLVESHRNALPMHRISDSRLLQIPADCPCCVLVECIQAALPEHWSLQARDDVSNVDSASFCIQDVKCCTFQHLSRPSGSNILSPWNFHCKVFARMKLTLSLADGLGAFGPVFFWGLVIWESFEVDLERWRKLTASQPFTSAELKDLQLWGSGRPKFCLLKVKDCEGLEKSFWIAARCRWSSLLWVSFEIAARLKQMDA